MGKPKLTLGRVANSFPLWPQYYTLTGDELARHIHVLGVTGTGKSKFLESVWLQLFRQGIGVSFIDPNADSVNALLSYLVQQGHFQKRGAYDKLLYIEFREDDFFLPFNILRQPAMPHAIASQVLEAFHRAYPELEYGAAAFNNIVENATKMLISSNLPLTALAKFLTDEPFRKSLYRAEEDWDVVHYFTTFFDRMPDPQRIEEVKSTLRRIRRVTFNPVLKYSLGQEENRLDFASLIDQGVSVLFNLGSVADKEARRLLGCLLTIGYEEAAKSREGSGRPRTRHHLIIDEMGLFVSQSEDGLSTMLSETRKYGLFAIPAHQTWSQTTAKLRGALQNATLEVSFGIGVDDAEAMARQVAAIDPLKVKHEVSSESALDRTHPVFYSIPEQHQSWTETLKEQEARHAVVKLRGKPAVQIKTLPMPKARVRPEAIESVKLEYRRKLMKTMAEIKLVHQGDSEKVLHTKRSG
ncbi:MAG: hypothetical protein JW384_01964 [Nitrosomonadaceae bacterium]|nr:hypothetical protein [Nitrosomonadaceae bacterium]